MASIGEEGDFSGKLRLPLPETFSGNPADWEEWSWTFKSYICMFEPQALDALDRAEQAVATLTDVDLRVTLDDDETVDQEATDRRVLFSKRLHYLLAQLCKDSARLVVRQNIEGNGFETWRRLYAKFALPDATRATSLLTQLLDFRFNPSTFEQDFNTWETLKVRYERQVGAPLPDGVLVATLLNKTSGALQQHLRLNARTLTTYQQTRDTIVEYFRSKLILTSSSSSQGPAPMDIGFVGKGKKGKGKGKSFGSNFGKGKGKGKGPHWSYFGNLKGKGKGKGKGKSGKGKDKGKYFGSSGSSSSSKGSFPSSTSAVCWKCGRTGHFQSKCPLNRVSAVEEDEELYFEEEDFDSWEDWTVGALFDDWSWYGESWDSWDNFGWDSWGSDFAWSDPSQETFFSQDTLTTSPMPQEASDDAALPKAAPVSALTVGEPPGLSRPKAKAKPKATLSPSSLLISAVVLGNFGLGSSCNTVGLLSGHVDFSFGSNFSECCDEQQSFASTCAPLHTFDMTDPKAQHNHQLLSIFDLGIPDLKTTFEDKFLGEHLVASTFTNEDDWILFDSGAATHCCPKDFAADWPLLPLTGRAPPLRSISGQPLTVFGRRLVKVDFSGQSCYLHFYVCDVPYCVVSVGRLLRQGYSVTLSGVEHTLSSPDGGRIPVERHGSLLFLRPTLVPFDKEEFVHVCNVFHSNGGSQGTLIAPASAPFYYHTDRWELSGNILTRIHKRSRATFFAPDGTKDRPVALDDLADERTTFLEYADGTTETLVENWRALKDPKCKAKQRFTGKTVFKLNSTSTGRRIREKTSTFPQPSTLQTKEPQQEAAKEKHPRVVTFEDTFKERLAQAGAGTLDELKTTLVSQLSEQDPSTQQLYTHDIWLNLPTFWVRMHYVERETLFVPEDPHFEEQLGDGRMTLFARPEQPPEWHCDDWRRGGFGTGVEPFVGATCFEKALFEAENAEPEADDFVAQRPRGIKQPYEPTLTERLEHELTHLPFKPWCEVCLRSKSKQAKSRKLSLRQPVLQMDFSFLSDKPGEDNVTILNVVDVLTGMSLSVVIPTKARTTYSQAELRRFVLETGRTFGVLQCDPEPALLNIAEAVTGEVGGLSLRKTPVGWKQAQGSVGNMQATLYGQIKALRLELLHRYNVELSVHSALFTWLVRHSQWLVNRYLQNAGGTTAFERRWGRKYNGALCRFGETVLFRRKQHKGQLSWFEGIWLGKDTESDQHFVADATGVFKTRSVKRFPPSKQANLQLLQSVKARPWDPTGVKAETDTFVFPSEIPSRAPDADPTFGGAEPHRDSEEHSEIPPMRELFGDDEDEDVGPMEEDFEAPAQPEPASALGARSSTDAELSEPPALRPRLEEAPLTSPSKRTSETLPVGSSKVQRIACVTFDQKKKKHAQANHFCVAAVTSKEGLEVPVAVNQDEKELLLNKTLEDPQLWYETEFPRDEEVAGMQKEMRSMRDFDVFDEVDTKTLSEETLSKAISTRWVKVRKSDGKVRCRIVVRGYTQEVNDRDEVFASTPSLTTLKLLLTLTSAFGWFVTTGDVSTAFLHAPMDTDIFVIPPLEFYPEGGVLWKLKRALYGLRNAPKLWQEHFAACMKKNCFERMKSDPNLYVHKEKRLYVLAYVDDLMFFGSKPDVELCVQQLQKDLLLKLTGTLEEGRTVTFLGREIRRTTDACELFMKPEYIESMLKLYGMSNCKPAVAPGADTLRKSELAEPLNAEDHKRFRRAVGQLLWLSNVRPDILYAVKELSRGLSAPTTEHETKVKHLLRFLSGSKHFTQQLRPTLTLSPHHKALDIQVFVDSDWAGCHETRRSTSGVSLFVLGSNILAHSRTQATVALSSGEAELYAIGSGVADALFVRSLLEESRLFGKTNIFVSTDSAVGKSIVSRFGASRKTKHVQLRFLYMQELVTTGLVRMKKVLGTLNPADILTKYVPGETLYRHLPTFGFGVSRE